SNDRRSIRRAFPAKGADEGGRRCKDGSSLDLELGRVLVGFVFLCRRETLNGVPLAAPLHSHANLSLALGSRLSQHGHSTQGFRIQPGYQVNVTGGVLLPELTHLNFH